MCVVEVVGEVFVQVWLGDFGCVGGEVVLCTLWGEVLGVLVG